MVAALKAKQIPVAYVTFPTEQHGFREAANINRALTGEFYFYSQIFGFQPADEIEPILILFAERLPAQRGSANEIVGIADKI